MQTRRTAPTTERPHRVDVLGCSVDPLDIPATVARCDEIIQSGRFSQQVSINAAKVTAMRDDQRLSRIAHQCELVSVDGQSVVWASKLLGCPVPERVPGIELMFELLALAERRGYRVYILGSRQHVLDAAVEALQQRYPRLNLCGWHHGYFSEGDEGMLAEEIRGTAPNILLVAMSSPRKEYWLAEYGPSTGAQFGMGVGGSIDVVAGVTRRAPEWMQQVGLEWFYRLIQEPRRLGRRYAVSNTQFLGMLAAELIRTRAGRLRRAV
jgi:N-acetylglucosaminyldiphosphoundecaprenol N-acetyl-beta-D-mannosaminyltransferase